MKTIPEIIDMIEAWHLVETAVPDQHGMLAEIERSIREIAHPTQPASGAVDEMEKIAAYPKTRADELSAETMRALARAALSVNQVNAAQPQKFEISPNVDLVELRKHVSHGYTPSSATILDMINFILCHAAQPDDLSSAIERGTKAWANTPDGWVDDLRGGEERPETDAEDVLWELLNAVTDELNRRAVPGAWLSIAYNTGSTFITKRRAAIAAQPAKSEQRG